MGSVQCGASLDSRGDSLAGSMKETTRYCYKLNQQDVGLMASDKISKGFPIISLWELIVDHGN